MFIIIYTHTHTHYYYYSDRSLIFRVPVQNNSCNFNSHLFVFCSTASAYIFLLGSCTFCSCLADRNLTSPLLQPGNKGRCFILSQTIALSATDWQELSGFPTGDIHSLTWNCQGLNLYSKPMLWHGATSLPLHPGKAPYTQLLAVRSKGYTRIML